METLSWKCIVLVAIALFSIAMAVPVPQDPFDELSPVAAEENNNVNNVDRDKRKIFGPEVGLGAKSAILGYVFGKIDGIIDAKTRLIDSFDATNAAKNKQYGIEAPAPINSLQQLLQAVISPKIAAITSKFGALSGASAGGFGGSSGFGGGAPAGVPVGDDSDSSDHANLDEDGLEAAPAAGALGGSGNILGSFLKLSGPILSSSSASAKGGPQIPIEDADASEE